jgi:subtilisin family serine protease
MINPLNTTRAASVRCPLHVCLCAIFAFALLAPPAHTPPAGAQRRLPDRIPVLGRRAASLAPVDSVLVKLRPGLSPETLLKQFAGAGAASPPAKRAVGPGAGAPALSYVRSNSATGWHVFRLHNPADLSRILPEIRKAPGVLSAQPDYRARLLIDPPIDPYYGVQNWQDLLVVISQLDLTKDTALQDDLAYWHYTWSLETINALNAWSIFPGKYYTAADRTQTGVYLPLVGVVDTGVDMTHPDFSLTGNPGRAAFTYDYTFEANPDPSNVFASATHDTDVKNGGQLVIDLARSFIAGEYPVDSTGNPNYEAGDPRWAIDGYGHGTSVSGIIAAAANKNYGVPGLAFCSELVPLKVIDNSGSGTEDEIEAAMIYGANHGCIVLNLSLALDTTDYSQAMQDTVNYCWRKGCLVVAAAGNDNDAANPTLGATHRYPANCERVLAVAASAFGTAGSDHTSPGTTTSGEKPATYSNYGPNIGVIAPGGDITYFNDPTDTLSSLGYDPAPQYVLPFTLAPTYIAALSDPNNADGLYFSFFLYGVQPDGTRMSYGAIPGTSLATPHVTGLAALYAAKYHYSVGAPPTPQQMINAIERGAALMGSRTDGGLSSPSTSGYGRIDAAATVSETNARNATVGGLVGQVLVGNTIQPNLKVSAQQSRHGIPVRWAKVYKATTGPDGIYRMPNLPTSEKAPFTYTVSVTISYIGADGHVRRVVKTLPSVPIVPGCDQHGIDITFN